MAYSGRFKPKNPEKYRGDIDQIVYRSNWERKLMIWLDNNSNVAFWGSETVIVPYLFKIDNKIHRYFVDFLIEFENGVVYLVEVKPNKETKPPKPQTKKNKYMVESIKYVKNMSKWEAANQYAKKQGWIFEVWDEFYLEKLGIKLQKPLRRMKKLNRSGNNRKKRQQING